MIDYSIHRGRGTGAKIDLAPGHTGPVDGEFIHVDEDAFFAIESFFDDGKISHYGASVVSALDWSKAITDIAAEAKVRLGEAQLQGFHLAQIENWHWLARHPQVLDDVRSRGMAGLLDLLAMLDEFAQVGTRWSTEYPAVYVSGV